MSNLKIGRQFNLGSSSKGNAFYIEINRRDYPNTPYKLLIECGFPFNKLREKLLDRGISIRDIDAVLITHEHLDHSESVRELVNYDKVVFAPPTVFARFGLEDKITERNIMHAFKEKAIADGIKVFGLPLEHMSDHNINCDNLGYVITIDDEFRIGFFTDTNIIKWDMSKYKFDMIYIEANYETMTMKIAIANEKEKPHSEKLYHYERVLKSHMSVEHTGMTLANWNLSKTKAIFLTHLTTNTNKNYHKFKAIVSHYISKKQSKIPQIFVCDEKGNIV